MAAESTKGHTLERLLGNAPDEVRNAARDPKRICGKYVLVNPLGRGGMGIVWRAWDARLSRMVALKFLSAEASRSTSVVERLISEARIAARLRHEHICQVYDVANAGGRHYIAMQLVAGQSLDRLKLPPVELARVLRQAALALDFAHGQGVIHRDVKPGNIMVEDGGMPYVMDFGIAKDTSSGQHLTQTGAVIGSPAFMSPEQGKSQTVDARSDVYSLGATLYAGLVGAPPFEGDGPLQVLFKVTTTDPIPPSQRVEGVPPALEHICLRAMNRDPARRYSTAKAMAEDLDAFLSGNTAAVAETMPLPAAPRVVSRSRPSSSAHAVAGTARMRSSTVERRSRRRGGHSAPPLAIAAAAAATLLLAAAIYLGAGRTDPPIPSGGAAGPGPAKTKATPPGTTPVNPGNPDRPTAIPTPPDPTAARTARIEQVEAAVAEAEAELSRPGVSYAGLRSRLNTALSTWDELLADDEADPRALFGRARTLKLLFRFAEAERDLDVAIAKAPAVAEAYLLRARMRLQHILELRFGHTWILSAEQETFASELGRKAAADLRVAQEHGLSAPAARALLAFAEMNYSDCIASCHAGLSGLPRGAPESWELLALRGDARYFSLSIGDDMDQATFGALAEVRADYDAALMVRPGDYQTRVMRGNVLEKLGQFDLARADFEVALELRPEDPLACWFMGGYHSRRATETRQAALFQQAIVWYDRGLASAPDSFPNLIGRGQALASLNQMEPALQDIRRATEVHPAHYFGWYMLGALLGRMQRAAEGVRAIEHALEINAGHVSSWYNLGALSFNAGDYVKARGAWQRALDLGYAPADQLKGFIARCDELLGRR